MRKAVKFWSLFVLGAGLAVPALVLGHGNEAGESSTEIGGGTVKVEFTGPALQGRDPMSMIKPGQYWRMGADRPTKLTTDVALKFGDQQVPAGEYTLVAELTEGGQWNLVVAEGVGSGWQPTKVVAKAPMAKSKTDVSVENMKIKLEGDGAKGKLVVEWGTNRLTTDFSAA